MKKLLKVVMLLFFFFAVSQSKVCAQVVINEFSSNSDPEWVELYNTGASDIDLTGWTLVDEASHAENLSGTISAHGYLVYERSGGWLNNSGGDVVNLKNSSDVVLDSISYGHSGDTVGTLSSDKSAGRIPDGNSNWVNNLIWTKGATNYQATSTPTPTPSPTKATYTINKSKDNQGSTLSSVQIYVDGNYVHHEDDEILEFFSGHECYSGVSCDFGNHTITLKKSGYSDWSNTENFTAGATFNVNPILDKEETSTPTPSPSPTATPTPTTKASKSPSPTPGSPSPSPSSSGNQINVLGVESTASSESDSEKNNSKGSKTKIPFLAIVLIIIGFGFIAVPIFSIIRNAKKKTDGSDTNLF